MSVPQKPANSGRSSLPLIIALLIVVVLVAAYFWPRGAGKNAAHVETANVPVTAMPAPVAATNAAAAGTASAADSANAQAGTAAPAPSAAPIAIKPKQPLPPPGTALSQIYDDLNAQAQAGDAEAASRLYHDLTVCAYAHSLSIGLTQTLGPPGAPRASSGLQDAQIDAMLPQIDFVKKNETMCQGLSEDQLGSTIPLAFQAAQLGDTQAADCYVGTSTTDTQALSGHPDWISQFNQNAVSIADNALSQGDWNMVRLMQGGYSRSIKTSLFGQLVGMDPSMVYRYIKLESLGATDYYATFVNSRLNAAKQGLAPDAIESADQWAQSTYQQYFAGSSSNVLQHAPPICGTSLN